ncbi:MAG: response regulator transcription factor [Anaerolineae bacterium]|nr:response regulator transcription factor [Anaerolineae bacterium]
MVTAHTPKSILLVEDNRDLAEVIQRELTTAGFRLYHAADAATALQLHAQHHPDLLILDWMLPGGMDGLDVLKKLRQGSALPVLMLTARDEEADRVIGLELGADDYLTKPFSMRELIARVRALFRRAEQIEQTIQQDRALHEKPVKIGGLVIDPHGYLVTIDGVPLDLTRTEFLLLYLLARNPGRAFSRDYLLDAVWGQHFVEGDRSVDNCVLRLRKKLGALADHLETVWSIGYRWQHGEAS